MLLVWHHMPDRSKVMTQTKRDTLVLQAGGLGVRLTPSPHKNIVVEKLLKLETRQKQQTRHNMNKDLRVGMWTVLSLRRSGALQSLNIRSIY